MKIYWDTDVNAPCCPGQIVAEDGRSILAQTDWDYPSVAMTFGWLLTDVQNGEDHCDHECTDGTVPCNDCGIAPGQFIEAASDWLDDHDGAEVEDPGYFDEGEQA